MVSTNGNIEGESLRLTKIYTKVGDKGTTLLASGQKISKASSRVSSYGAVDELNAQMGYFADTLNHSQNKSLLSLGQKILTIQNSLFDIGGELSLGDFEIDESKMRLVGDIEIANLEKDIDQWNSELPPLENFVLPGGNRYNSLSHIARTVCRRAEREVVKLSEEKGEKLRPAVMIYLNRLSDWLFVLGRFIMKETSTPEKLWQQHP